MNSLQGLVLYLEAVYPVDEKIEKEGQHQGSIIGIWQIPVGTIPTERDVMAHSPYRAGTAVFAYMSLN